jgi:hypothetical protein
MKEPIQWTWKSMEKIILYTIISICFSISFIISIDNKKKTKKEVIASVLVLVGFLVLLLFQFRQKWIWGFIVILIVTILSIYITHHKYKLYKRKVRFSLPS